MASSSKVYGSESTRGRFGPSGLLTRRCAQAARRRAACRRAARSSCSRLCSPPRTDRALHTWVYTYTRPAPPRPHHPPPTTARSSRSASHSRSSTFCSRDETRLKLFKADVWRHDCRTLNEAAQTCLRRLLLLFFMSRCLCSYYWFANRPIDLVDTKFLTYLARRTKLYPARTIKILVSPKCNIFTRFVHKMFINIYILSCRHVADILAVFIINIYVIFWVKWYTLDERQINISCSYHSSSFITFSFLKQTW